MFYGRLGTFFICIKSLQSRETTNQQLLKEMKGDEFQLQNLYLALDHYKEDMAYILSF